MRLVAAAPNVLASEFPLAQTAVASAVLVTSGTRGSVVVSCAEEDDGAMANRSARARVRPNGCMSRTAVEWVMG